MAFVVKYNTRAFIRDDQIVSEFERKRARVYRRFGSIVRRESRRRLARGTGGSPRSRQKFEPNLRTIFYGLEDDVVLIGPVGFGGGLPTVPELHEFGGSKLIRLPDGKKVLGTYKPRAFMGPTLIEKAGEMAIGIEKFGLV